MTKLKLINFHREIYLLMLLHCCHLWHWQRWCVEAISDDNTQSEYGCIWVLLENGARVRGATGWCFQGLV